MWEQVSLSRGQEGEALPGLLSLHSLNTPFSIVLRAHASVTLNLL